VTCAHCGAEVPDGEFCTRCGAHRGKGTLRLHQYALRPGEHVAAPNVLSTLLPRLTHERLHSFRWGLIAGIIVVTVLAATGLVVPAIWASTLLVPVLYLAYLRETDVYADAPVLVLAATVIAGAAVGVAVTAAGDALGAGLGAGGVILIGVGIAVVAELLKPVVPLLLLHRRFPSTVDGLVFGVAAGVGYALAQACVNLSGALAGVPLRVEPSGWTFTLFSVGLLIPLLHGSCSGLVAAALWRPRGGRDAALRAAGLPLAITADVLFTAGSEILDDAGLSPLFVLLWQAVVVAAVLIAVRMLLHAAVLDEAAELGLREVHCHVCGRTVDAAAFCPDCGASVTGAVPARTAEPVLRR
jgi:RsiW-degrading membrane proteinase PrsW (M82 family)